MHAWSNIVLQLNYARHINANIYMAVSESSNLDSDIFYLARVKTLVGVETFDNANYLST
jgi:hypothetical protein